MTKAELRTIYTKLRQDLSEHRRTELSGLIADRFFREIDLSGVGSAHCFISMGHKNEIETFPIFERFWIEYPAVRTFAPRVNENSNAIDSVPFDRGTPLTTNNWGIAEPVGEPLGDPRKIDLVLVPLLSFDESGHRVGYGKGFYDKFLLTCRADCLKIGLSFFPPVERLVDISDHDVPLDLCITPETIYDPAPK